MFRAPLQRAIFHSETHFLLFERARYLKIYLKNISDYVRRRFDWNLSLATPPPLLAVKWCVGTAMYRQEAYGEEK